MKRTMPINNIDDLEKEVARLHRRVSANQAAMLQQWKGLKKNAVKLCWNSFRTGCASNLVKSAMGSKTDNLIATVLQSLIKWTFGKFKGRCSKNEQQDNS